MKERPASPTMAEERASGVTAIIPREREVFSLGGGRRIEIRPTTAADADRLAELYVNLPPVDRRKRFFSAWTPKVEWCRQWASIGERGGYGVIAIVHADDESTELVAGEAGYAVRPDSDGDLAVTVATGWRGWLGAYLLDRLIEHAACAGIQNLQADVLLENTAMLRVLKHRGSVALEHSEGTEHLSISTTGYVPSWPPGDHRKRVLVEVVGGRWSDEQTARRSGMSVAMCAGPALRSRHGCPVLSGRRCPLADGADAVLVLLDPDDETTTHLVTAHRTQNPATPIIVRAGNQTPDGCHLLTGDADVDFASLRDVIS
jgi:RimJ/RimL family protein N-acetyltransferase